MAVAESSMQQGKRMTRGSIIMVVVMMFGSFLAILNQNLINTALPTLMGAFSISPAQVQWLATVYTLTTGVTIPVTAYLVGRFSTRKLFLAAFALFACGTALAGLAPGFEVLLVGRIVQALGASINMTLMQTVLFTVFPPDRRGTAMGIYGLVISFAPAFGPAIAGFVIDSFSWRSLFLMQLPCVAILFVAAVFLVKNITGGHEGRLDVPSVALSTVGFGGVLYAFGSVSTMGVSSPIVIGALVVGAICVVLFIVRQRRIDVPVLDFRVFSHRGFTSALVLQFGTWSLYMVSILILPLLIQDMLGFSATESGLALMGGGIAMGILSPLMGRAYDSFGPRVLIPPGIAVICAALVLLALAGEGTPLWRIAVAYTLFIAGLSMCNGPLTTCALNALPQELVAHGSAMNNTARSVGSSMAVAIFVSLMALIAGPDAAGVAQIPAARVVFVCLAVLAALMVVVSAVVFRNGAKR